MKKNSWDHYFLPRSYEVITNYKLSFPVGCLFPAGRWFVTMPRCFKNGIYKKYKSEICHRTANTYPGLAILICLMGPRVSGIRPIHPTRIVISVGWSSRFILNPKLFFALIAYFHPLLLPPISIYCVPHGTKDITARFVRTERATSTVSSHIRIPWSCLIPDGVRLTFG